MTASEVGPPSEIRSTFAFSLSSDDSTGSVQVAVPTIVSAIPRESWISVEDWFSDTVRAGAFLNVNWCPQLSMVRGKPAAEAPEDWLAEASAGWSLAAPAQLLSSRADSSASEQTDFFTCIWVIPLGCEMFWG